MSGLASVLAQYVRASEPVILKSQRCAYCVDILRQATLRIGSRLRAGGGEEGGEGGEMGYMCLPLCITY